MSKHYNPFGINEGSSLSKGRELHWEESAIDNVSQVEGFTSGVSQGSSICGSTRGLKLAAKQSRASASRRARRSADRRED
jgi:hypothetical protein